MPQIHLEPDPSSADPAGNEPPRFLLSCPVDPLMAGIRLDLYVARQLPDLSRSLIGRMMGDGLVLVNGMEKKASYRLSGGDMVTVAPPLVKSSHLDPHPIDFTVLHEDGHLLVLVKPPGLVVHPAPGNAEATLAHGLLHHCRHLPGLADGRPGIVHRLDKDTSGIMVAAKTDRVLALLSEAFKERQVEKKYLAILKSCPPADQGVVDQSIGRHPVHRQKMAVREGQGRHAVSRYEVLERLCHGTCLVEVGIATGRTHQIRVHMAFLGCPVLGDPVYGGQGPRAQSMGVTRQMLHAGFLAFRHPISGERLSFTAPLWPDMQAALEQLRDRCDD